MNKKTIILVVILILLSLLGMSIVKAFEETISFSYEGMYKGKNFVIERYKDLEQNNTCYIMYGTTNSNAIGSFGGISCVKEEPRIIYFTSFVFNSS